MPDIPGNNPVTIRMPRQTAGLHWLCFSIAAQLPNTAPETRLRFLELARLYLAAAKGQADEVYTGSDHDRQIAVEVHRTGRIGS